MFLFGIGLGPANPMLQGGAWTTASDYAAFLTMIAQNGQVQGRQILSAEAVARMGRVMTLGLRKGFTAPGAQGKDVEYLLAHWCERRVEDRCTFETSPGLYGTYPWVDRDSGLHGVIFLKDRLRRISRAALSSIVLVGTRSMLLGVMTINGLRKLRLSCRRKRWKVWAAVDG